MLAVELATLQEEEFDLDLLGFDDEELERLREALDGPPAGDENAVPEVEETAVSQTGDLWLLGEPRVLCGNALSREAIDRVLDGEPAAMVFTDPPYNVEPFRKPAISGCWENIAFSAAIRYPAKRLIASWTGNRPRWCLPIRLTTWTTHRRMRKAGPGASRTTTWARLSGLF